jgi:DNA-binding CsgD family transcriptional regulator
MTETSDIDRLTPRQLEVLQCYADGLTGREAAERLGIAYDTLRTHRSTILRILSVKTITRAVVCALARGRISSGFSASIRITGGVKPYADQPKGGTK